MSVSFHFSATFFSSATTFTLPRLILCRGIANDERREEKDGQQRVSDFTVSERKKATTERRTDSKSGPRVIRGGREEEGRTNGIEKGRRSGARHVHLYPSR